MRLGLNAGAWGIGRDSESLDLVATAEQLGYDICWISEAYGNDVVSVLGWLAAKTTTIEIGSAIAQIPARSPVMTAMTAATLDSLSAGRFRIGLGVSGPQVAEGLHGVPFAHPVARTREYVEILQMALRRDPVVYRGQHYQLPLRPEQRPLRLLNLPTQPEIPMYLAAIGPRNVALAGECFNGVLSLFVDPNQVTPLFDSISRGRSRARNPSKSFEVVASVPVAVGPDQDRCIDLIRPFAALYLGGMGSREQNFYNRLACELGYAAEAARVQDRYLAGDRLAAAAAVPAEFIAATSLVGDQGQVHAAMDRYEKAGIGTLSLNLFNESQAERIAALRIVSQGRRAAPEGRRGGEA